MSAPTSPFDPAEVLTTHTLQAYMDMGRPMLNNYIRYAKVGGGQHGEVYLCYRSDPKLPRIPVAMKSVRRDNPRAEQLKKLRQRRLPTTPHTPLADRLNTTEAKIRKEIAIMKKCRHPHVVRLYEVIDDRMRDKIYMVMEYLGGGEVKWRNDNNEPILTVEQTRRIMRDAVLGLEYLHYQGIIHRDIKPANLLWTEDRRQVKIGDFGVSHFSYAQRLAAAGKEGDKDPHDPILQDDSDLTRRAGTPSFLAPEVVFEHTYEPPSSGSSSLRAVGSSSTVASLRPRPPITKAIDVWALGVTLYCLLFGKTPFFADPTLPSSEWSLYNSICNNDWDPEETMGFDHSPTGGRHPPDDDSEGTLVMHLLNHFLEKDVAQRITLDEVKRNPWILRGLPEPKKWLVVTSPTFKINVSKAETSVAMSNVRFSWNWSAVRRIFSHLRPQQQRLRQNNVKRRRRAEDDGRGPVMSDPQVERHKPPSRRPPKPGRKQEIEVNSRTPLVRSYERISETTASAATAGVQQRSKSIDRWYPSSSRPTTSIIIPTTIINHNNNSNNSSPTALRIGGTRARRGSESQGSQGGTPSSPSGSDRPRARFSQFIASLSNWRSSSYGGSGSSSKSVPASDALGGGSGGGGTQPLSTVPPRSYPASAMGLPLVGRKGGKGQVMRRSEEALRHPQRGPYPVYASSSLSSAHHSPQNQQHPHHYPGGQQQQQQQSQQRPYQSKYQQGRYTQAVYGNQHHAHSYHPLAVSGGASGLGAGGGRRGSGDGDGDESGGGYSPPSASGLLTAARRASSWGYEGMDHSEYVDVVSVRSDRVELDESEMIVGAGGVVGGVGVMSGASVRALPQGQLANLSGRVVTPGSGMGSGATRAIAGPGPSLQRVSFYDDDETERARYGPPGFDDSSTIASGSVSGSGSGSGDESSSGEWQRGSGLFLEDEVPEGDDEPVSASGAGGGGEGGEGGGRDEARKSGEEGDNEADSDEDDNRVTFSPKRRTPAPS